MLLDRTDDRPMTGTPQFPFVSPYCSQRIHRRVTACALTATPGACRGIRRQRESRKRGPKADPRGILLRRALGSLRVGLALGSSAPQVVGQFET